MSFGYYRSLTIDHTKVGTTDQTNFPVLVSLTNADFKTTGNGGLVTSASGFDIVFYPSSALGTKLDHEILKYVASTGEIIMMVRVPTVSHTTDTVFYVAYADSGITTSQENKTGVYDANFKAIYHLNDNAGTTTLVDSTGSTSGINNANTSTKTTAGQFGSALIYNGTSDYSTMSVDLSSANVVTIEFWMWWDTFANDDALAGEYSTNYNSNSGFLINPNSSSSSGKFEVSIGPSPYWGDDFTRPTAAAWHHYALVFDRATPVNKAFVDGSMLTLTADNHGGVSGNFANSTLYLMSRAGSALFGAGKLQECRASLIERSADWILTGYNNQSSPSTFITLGAQTSTGTNVTVTPGIATLTTTKFAPVIALAVIPSTKALTLTTFAPQVNLAVIPSTTALTLATFAPNILVGTVVVPGVKALSLSTFAPTVVATANVTVTPSTAALSITAFAPNVNATANITVTPGVLNLALTSYAPTVSTGMFSSVGSSDRTSIVSANVITVIPAQNRTSSA